MPSIKRKIFIKQSRIHGSSMVQWAEFKYFEYSQWIQWIISHNLKIKEGKLITSPIISKIYVPKLNPEASKQGNLHFTSSNNLALQY